YLNGLTLQPDGKLLLTGTFTRVNGEPHDSLVRLNQDGSLDSSFQAGFGFVQVLSNEVSVMALFPDGRILVKVTDPLAIPISILLLGKDGKFDTVFIHTSSPQPDPIYSSVSGVPTQDGKILIIGSYAQGLVRLGLNGGIDDTFKPNFKPPPNPN